MACEDLSQFLATAEHAGELVRVTTETDPVLEIAEVTQRLAQTGDGGPAILFENVRGRAFPIVTNLLGSERRLSSALYAESLDEVEYRVESLLHPEIDEGWLGSLKLLPRLAQLTRLPPKVVKTGRSQQVVRVGRDIDLHELPFLQCWPRERAATITAGQIVTRHPETGQRHVGSFPLSVRGQDVLGLHWTLHDVAYRHFEGYRAERRQMPVAIVLGGDPVLWFLASGPLPREADACLLSGFFRDANVELVSARTVDLHVPACADLVIEGVVDPEIEIEPTGPVALSTGYYTVQRECTTMSVTAVTHRSNPVIPCTVPAPPPSEQMWIDRGMLHLLRPLVRLVLPEVHDLHCPAVNVERNIVFVGIRKEYPQQARKVMNALWGMRGFSTTKWIVVVDSDVNVRNDAEVWYRVGTNTHPGRDVLFSEGPASYRDHAAPVPGAGHRIGIDATRKTQAEGHPRDWPDELHMTEQMRQFVEGRFGEYGITREPPP